MQPSLKPINIFYLCDDDSRDKEDARNLRSRLEVLERRGTLYEIPEPRAGATVKEALKKCLAEAEIIIFVVTSNFSTNTTFNSQEIVDHIQMCHNNGAHIWPVMVRYVAWKWTAFHNYPLFIGDDKAIVENSELGHRRFMQTVDKKLHQLLSQKWAKEGDTYVCQRQLTEARFAYEQSMHSSSTSLAALLGMIRVCCMQGAREEAEHFFGKLASYEKEETRMGNNDDFPYYYYQGHALLELGRYADAITAFEKLCQQLEPPSNNAQQELCAQASCSKGDALWKVGQQKSSQAHTYYNRALKAYEHAKNLQPANLHYWLKIGNAYLALADHTLADTYYKYAQQVYEEIIYRDPGHPLAYVGKGDVFSRMKRYDDALAAYTIALKFDPHIAQAHGGKGQAHLERNEHKEALSAFQHALALESDIPQYEHGLGRALASLDRFEDALKAYTQAKDHGLYSVDLLIDQAIALQTLAHQKSLSMQQTSAHNYAIRAQFAYEDALTLGGHAQKRIDSIYQGLGNIHFARKDWDSALDSYQKAIEAAPYKADAYLGMGRTLIACGQYEKASNFLNTALSSCRHPETTVSRAEVEIALGDVYYQRAHLPQVTDRLFYQKKARAHYQDALHSSEKSTQTKAYIGLAKTYAELGSYEEAIHALDVALQLAPNLGEGYFLKGICYYELGQFAEASKMYSQAIANNFDEPHVFTALGYALLELNAYEPALDIFEALITRPDVHAQRRASAYGGRGIALQRLDMHKEAVQAFELAQTLDHMICAQSQYRVALGDVVAATEKALQTNPQESSLYTLKGDTLMLLEERIAEAIDAYTLAIRSSDPSADLYYRRGKAHEKRKHYRKALLDYHQVLKIDSLDQYAHQSIEKIMQERLNPLERFVFQHFYGYNQGNTTPSPFDGSVHR